MKSKRERSALAEHPVMLDQGELTATWLTGLLRAGGHLTNGSVDRLGVELWRGKDVSNFYRLKATYTTDSVSPRRLILKVSRPDVVTSTAQRRRWKEHEFYSRLVPEMERPPVPMAFASAYDGTTHQSHLLMEDLADSHTRPPTPLPPTPDQLRGDVDCLAHIHAWWWAHPDLGGVSAARDDRWIHKRAAATRRNLSRFMKEFGPYIPMSIRSALETACAGWPSILRRSAKAPLTVVHGDAHPWNFLSPHAPSATETRLLDWEGWSTEPGPHDLASLLALHLPRDVRLELEDELLERYQNRLRDLGVAGYDLAACRVDYQRAITRRVLSPVGLWSRGGQARSWWPMLERVTAAFHDLDCADVL